MAQAGSWKRAVALVVFLAAYVGAGKVGLALAFLHPSASPVWPPTGIALAGLLLFGLRAWPVVLLGAFIVNMSGVTGPLASLAIAIGNACEAVVGAWLVQRYAGGRNAFQHPRTVFAFVILAALLATTLGASVGTTTLMVSGSAAWSEYGWIWLTWWLGDAVGAVVVTPVVVLWSIHWKVNWPPARTLEAALLLVSTMLVVEGVFGGLVPGVADHYPLEFLTVPFFLWAVFRFRPRETATLMVVVAGLAIHGTLLGHGPFAREAPNQALLLLQAFVGVAAVTALMLATVVQEHRRVEARLRELAVTDPLTGLANYRRLMDVLETEVERSGRTGRSFTVLFLDVDGLKTLNDRYGHLVGSRALCRVAEAIRHTCRAIDTPARFGGDEFAVVLPETSEVAAWGVAERIRERLAEDREHPPVGASTGLAVYPRDAVSVTALLNAADRRLYREKGTRAIQQPESEAG